MALFTRGSGGTEGDGAMTVVGPEASFEGTLRVSGSLCVEGTVEGNILDAASVLVGRHGKVVGDVWGRHVVIMGAVEGNIVAAGELELKAGSVVSGDIRAPKLLIEEGARFDGRCAMAEAEGPAESAERQESGAVRE